MKIIVNIDGGSRGNPGESACAFVIKFNNKKIIKGFYLNTMTNNQAEYTGLYKALEFLLQNNYINDEITVFSDSELLVKQINGEYKVKSKNLIDIYNNVKQLMKRFNYIEIKHIRREYNKEADKCLNRVLNRGKDEIIYT